MNTYVYMFVVLYFVCVDLKTRCCDILFYSEKPFFSPEVQSSL